MTPSQRGPNRQHEFCYRPLDPSLPSIRILEVSQIANDGIIICHLRHADITTKYTALSYMWGLETPCHVIELVDQSGGHRGRFKVRSNLHTFLVRAAVSEATIPFWTDAICIDQENVEERNQQVQQMGEIYRNASEVRVWLGEDSTTGAMLSAMSATSFKGDLRTIDLFDEKLCPTEFRAIFKPEKRVSLLQNEYWSRTWIVQEIILAARIVVQSAGGKTSWSTLAGLYALQRDQQSPHMQRLLGHWRAGDNLKISEFPRKYPINFLLDAFGSTRCSDKRDHVYGLLALVDNGDQLKVDYEEHHSQLLVRATRALKLDIGDLRPLIPALDLDAKSLFAECSIQDHELWKTQKTLSTTQNLLDTKWVFPACSNSSGGQCHWSETGTGTPCILCRDLNRKICVMPECKNDWYTEVGRIILDKSRNEEYFSGAYKSHFKQWLCSVWPDRLAGSHTVEGNHYQTCFACDLRKSAYDGRQEWANIERSLQESSTGHELPSLGNYLKNKSKPGLRTRRAGRPLALQEPSTDGPQRAKLVTGVWKELFKGTARTEGWE